MSQSKKDKTCCLCGLPYEQIGNNPQPLSMTGRCCDACDEIVIEARINPALFIEELKRVEQALILKWGAHDMAIAAICASRGPPLLAEKKRLLDQFWAGNPAPSLTLGKRGLSH